MIREEELTRELQAEERELAKRFHGSRATKRKMESLVVAGTSLGGFEGTTDWNLNAKEEGVEKAKENWLNHRLFETTNKNKTVKEKLKNMIDDYSGWHWVNPDPEVLINPKAIYRIENIPAPTLIIVGEKDIPDNIAIANILKEKIPRSEKIIFPNIGHMVNMEAAEAFNKTVADFLKK